MIRQSRDAQRQALLLANSYMHMREDNAARLVTLMRRHATTKRLCAVDKAEMHGMLRRRAAFGRLAQDLRNMAATLEQQSEALARVPVLRAVAGALSAVGGASQDADAVNRVLAGALHSANDAKKLLSRSLEPDVDGVADVGWSETLSELLPGVPADEPAWALNDIAAPLVHATQVKAREMRDAAAELCGEAVVFNAR